MLDPIFHAAETAMKTSGKQFPALLPTAACKGICPCLHSAAPEGPVVLSASVLDHAACSPMPAALLGGHRHFAQAGCLGQWDALPTADHFSLC